MPYRTANVQQMDQELLFSDKEEQNLISMHYKENIFYVTYRPVQPGEELLGKND